MVSHFVELPYYNNSTQYFEKIVDMAGAVFLDSGKPFGQYGRYDILSALPYIRLSTHGEYTEIRNNNQYLQSKEDPFYLLKHYLPIIPNSFPERPDLPFTGGAIGYFAYDLARRLEQLPSISQNDLNLPDMLVGIYDWAIIVDHYLQQACLVQAGQDPNTPKICEEVLQRLKNISSEKILLPKFIPGTFTSNLTETEYAHAFHRIQQHLRDGDCYQVNLAQRFCAPIQGEAWPAYQALRQRNPAAFGAFLKTPEGSSILSLSPERFIQVRNNLVETKPIKGTRPRHIDPHLDQLLAAELLNSLKDRAENVMIVDLMRNDIGKNCRIGSIRVPHLCALESFPSVHHLVSTVTGELAPNKSSLDLLPDCFPGGSITGAPKLRAMEIIEALEPHRRNVYCGSIGYIGFNGNMDTSISIRTLTWKDNHIYCYAGGAITADSTLKEEYAETFAKVSIILKSV